MMTSFIKYSFSLLIFTILHTSYSKAEIGDYVGNVWGDANRTFVADFNGDGKDDIASIKSDVVYMYLSTGDDFTQDGWSVTNEWGGSGFIWVDDFNNDTKADLATTKGNKIILYISTGYGFIKHETTPSSLKWGSAARTFTGDYNGDDKADILSIVKDTFYIHFSTGVGFETETWDVPNYYSHIWDNSKFIRTGYFNQDTFQDIISIKKGEVTTFLSQGDKFTSKTATITSHSWGTNNLTWTADFNNDGTTDIISAKGGTIYIHLNATDASFASHSQSVPNKWDSAGKVFAADLNGDGALSIVSFSGKNAYTYLFDGEEFILDTSKVPSVWGNASRTWSGDFSGNGTTGIASTSGDKVYIRTPTSKSFITQTWYSTEGQYRTLSTTSGATPPPDTVLPSDSCYLTYPGDWVTAEDTKRHLPLNVSNKDLNLIKLTPGKDLTNMDGLYIFVYKENGAFVIRRSDREDDTGYGVKGEAKYLYKDNPPYSPSRWDLEHGVKKEYPHQFVRHSQLNKGHDPVYSAGQLQIKNGKIIWVSNASGHFAPSFESLNCVTTFLDESNIQRTTRNFRKNFDWNKNKVPPNYPSDTPRDEL